jgi:hypothetical protein
MARFDGGLCTKRLVMTSQKYLHAKEHFHAQETLNLGATRGKPPLGRGNMNAVVIRVEIWMVEEFEVVPRVIVKKVRPRITSRSRRGLGSSTDRRIRNTEAR